MAIRKGVVDLGLVGGSHLRGLVPEAVLLGLSQIPAEEERTKGAIDFLRERYAKAGLYYVGRVDPKPERHFFTVSNALVTRPVEMAGLKFAANGTYVEAFAKALGTSFQVIKMADAYSGLERGTFELYNTAIDLMVALSIPEVVKYIIDHPVYRSNITIPMNLDSWNKLPPRLQKLMTDTYVEFEPKFIEVCRKDQLRGRTKFAEAGVQFIKFSAADAEYYVDVAYSSEIEAMIKQMPDTAPKFLKLVKAID
jgi:TRAP-type C4-dicarboxylate transport system substrate-binding protein